MATASSRGRNKELQVPRTYCREDRESIPERTREICSGSSIESNKLSKKVPVVYYLSRNGQLEHPHFMEVPLSSDDGLYLRDVINRLDLLRGKGMATLYSWSSKRSYKSGFVWHDLAEDDIICPAHGRDYILKGSELLDPSHKQTFLETTQSFRSPKPQETNKPSSSQGSDFPVIARRRNQSWSSVDLNEYEVYKTESFPESARKLASDASTQTEDIRRRRHVKEEEQEIEESQDEKVSKEPEQGNREEIIEISPPPSDSSPETLESLMRSDGRLVFSCNNGSGSCPNLNPSVENCGRTRASAVLMQLISCGSISFRDCGATAVKGQGLSLIGGRYNNNKGRLPPGDGNTSTSREISNFPRVKLEDKEYFSGSLIETKKDEVPALILKRSNSYTAADRSSQLQPAEKEIEGVRTKCIPRRSKAISTRKDGKNINEVTDDSNSNSNSRRAAGSKRVEVKQVENIAADAQ